MINNNPFGSYPNLKSLADNINVKDTWLFFDIVSYILLHTGKIITYYSITAFLKRRYLTLSPNTVKRYFNFLTDPQTGIVTNVSRCYIKPLHKTTELNTPLVRGKSYYFNNEEVVNEVVKYVLNEGQGVFEGATIDKCEIMIGRHILFKALMDQGCTLTSGTFAYFSRRGSEKDCAKPKQLTCTIELVCTKTVEGTEKKAYFAFPTHVQLKRNSHEFEVFTHCLKNSSIDENIYVVDFLSGSDPETLLSPNVKCCGLYWILENIQSVFLNEDVQN